MLERLTPLFKFVCLALGALVVYQASQLLLKRDVIARGTLQAAPIKEKTTNAPAQKPTNSPPTNATSASMPPGPMTMTPGAMAMVRGPGGRPGRGGGMSDLPADVQAAIEKIKTSQILGPDIKPPPMALLGIAGKDVFLRAPSGQTGIIREGEELGGVKLIKVGTNRVLVQEGDAQKELMIFEGFGGDSLAPKTEGKK